MQDHGCEKSCQDRDRFEASWQDVFQDFQDITVLKIRLDHKAETFAGLKTSHQPSPHGLLNRVRRSNGQVKALTTEDLDLGSRLIAAEMFREASRHHTSLGQGLVLAISQG